MDINVVDETNYQGFAELLKKRVVEVCLHIVRLVQMSGGLQKEE